MDISRFTEYLKELGIYGAIEERKVKFYSSPGETIYLLYECEEDSFNAAIALSAIVLTYMRAMMFDGLPPLRIRDAALRQFLKEIELSQAAAPRTYVQQPQQNRVKRLWNSEGQGEVEQDDVWGEQEISSMSVTPQVETQTAIPDLGFPQDFYGARLAIVQGRVYGDVSRLEIDNEYQTETAEGIVDVSSGARRVSGGDKVDLPPGTIEYVPGASPRVQRNIQW